VVIASGMTENGYVPVESRTLATRYRDVYALGDCATVGVPKAGVFSERAAGAVARALIARLRGDREPDGYDGLGSCYIEFGRGQIARVDIDFLTGPEPTGTFREPSVALAAEKAQFGASRKARWFGA
jgi:sulfide:quinone oxidoreductase